MGGGRVKGVSCVRGCEGSIRRVNPSFFEVYNDSRNNRDSRTRGGNITRGGKITRGGGG